MPKHPVAMPIKQRAKRVAVTGETQTPETLVALRH